LDDKITPADKLFVRNNGIYPDKPDISAWTLSLGGESVKKTKEYRLDELKKRFKSYTQQLVLECAGNGRSNFSPPAKGLNWSNGAVGCPQ
jgi:DMSO/TMAO reductase YedYZ molybdopterin-dependent catalytic subunit